MVSSSGHVIMCCYIIGPQQRESKCHIYLQPVSATTIMAGGEELPFGGLRAMDLDEDKGALGSSCNPGIQKRECAT